MGAYLSQHDVPNVVVTGQGRHSHGSNKHLTGFLRPLPGSDKRAERAGAEGKEPRALLSTSLLARGLDFDPSVSHVFVLEPPRNTADLLHRAGRTARAGGVGKWLCLGGVGGAGRARFAKCVSGSMR